jgi:hypothetical protein
MWFWAEILEYNLFDRQLNLGVEYSVCASKHSSNRVHLVTCILRIQVFCVAMLHGRVVDFTCFEGSMFLQISEINDPSTHFTTFMHKVQRAFEDALTL